MRKGRFTRVTRTALHKLTGDPGRVTALTKLSTAADELVNAANALRLLTTQLNAANVNKQALEAALNRSLTATRLVEHQVHTLIE
jgi:hypothetical protein